jgi:hypothetical protein
LWQSAVVERDELVKRLADQLQSDERVRAAWLSGSMGRGVQDEYSDVDVWAVIDPSQLDRFIADWPRQSERVSPQVLHQLYRFGPNGGVFNHVTPEWLRFDLAVGRPEQVAERFATTLRLLFDRDGLADSLQPSGQPLGPSPGTVERLVTEFLRVLGLLPVVVGRHDYVVAATGATLLRTSLIQLMIEDVAVEDRGGVLHLERLLPPERYASLAALPPIEATREAAIAAHVACARLFLPLGRDLAQRAGVAWPETLERAARAHLVRRLGIELGVDLA